VILAVCFGSPSQACSWFSPCKPQQIHRVKPKAKLDTTSLEKRLSAHEEHLKGHAMSIVMLQRQLIKLEGEIADLQKRQAAGSNHPSGG
jgi:hypothetical protein